MFRPRRYFAIIKMVFEIVVPKGGSVHKLFHFRISRIKMIDSSTDISRSKHLCCIVTSRAWQREILPRGLSGAPPQYTRSGTFLAGSLHRAGAFEAARAGKGHGLDASRQRVDYSPAPTLPVQCQSRQKTLLSDLPRRALQKCVINSGV